jgi:hypothetical protein
MVCSMKSANYIAGTPRGSIMQQAPPVGRVMSAILSRGMEALYHGARFWYHKTTVQYRWEGRMSEIKSALELALERTQNVQSDKKGLQAHEIRQEGKRLVSKYQENPGLDIKKELSRFKGEELAWAKEGFFQVITAGLGLPNSEADLAKLDMVETGLAAIIKDTGSLKYLFEQTRQLLKQFLENRQHLIEQLRTAFSERMRKREEELARQFGHPVKVDPAQDPEFAGALQQHMGRLQQQYEGVLLQLKEELDRMFKENL